MRTKQLGKTSQRIIWFLYTQMKPCSRKEIIDAVQDTLISVRDSLDTLVRNEIVSRIQYGYYTLAHDIRLVSDLDFAVNNIDIANIRKSSLSEYNYTVYKDTVVNLLVDSKQRIDDSKQNIEDRVALSVNIRKDGGVGVKNSSFSQSGVEMSGKVDLEAFFHDLVGDFVHADENAVKFRALCPVHQERTPSFWFNVSDGWFRCYGCGIEGMGMFDLLDKMGLDGEELLDYAYAYSLDVEPDEERSAKIAARELQHVDRVSENKRRYANEIVQVREWYANGFDGANVEDDWIDGKPTPERDYLFSRGIMPNALQHFKAAVFLNIPHHRMYFPLALNGIVYGYQRRDIKDSKHMPKYLTMTGMDKTMHVYGDVMGDTVLVTEGITDLMVGYQRGVTSIVTTLGAYVSDEQAYELFSLGIKHVIHATHNDHAGKEAYTFGRMTFAKFGIESKHMFLECDIADSRRDDFLKAYGDVATSF